jgi:MGT family glycosyltransferase
VPQQAILKMTDVFITHGGMNSVSEAMVEGVPMVVIPFMADQPTNARRVCELGIGKSIKYQEISAEILKKTVNAVLKDENILENVLKMKNMMVECPGNRGAVKEILEFYQKEK